jgi:hypothetical protein
MNTREFLNAVWPQRGPYCVAWFIPHPTAKGNVFAQTSFDDIDDVVNFTIKEKSNKDLFFAIHTLKQARIFDPERNRWRTRRLRANMKEARVFFFDVDVGKSSATAPKYASRELALSEIERFVFETRLPAPLLTSSGGGVHVYWRLDAALPSEDWRESAAKLHWLAKKHTLLVDPMRTTDSTSVLRISGSYNLKIPNQPRPVKVLVEGVETPTQDFLAILDARLGDEYPMSSEPAQSNHNQDNNTGRIWNGRETPPDELIAVCEHMKTFHDQRGCVPEPHWYVGLGTVSFAKDGVKTCHDWSSGHSNYTYAETQSKIEQWQAHGWPASCQVIDAKCGGDACGRCPNKGLGSNPLIIANQKQKHLPPAPLMLALLARPTSIPPPPCEPKAPYRRSAAGIVKATVNDKGVTVDKVISTYDMYPIDLIKGTEGERGLSRWVVTIAGSALILDILNTQFNDARELSTHFNDSGVYFDALEIIEVKKFMSAYLRELRAHRSMLPQCDHVGWSDKDKEQFILYDRVIDRAGTVTSCTMSKMARIVKSCMTKSGTLAAQVKLLEFYNHPRYIPNQFALLCALAAPLFYITGLGGSVVNISSVDSGASKSSTLYTAGAMWGDPHLYVTNGTKKGASTNFRNERIATLLNLPVCLDEITHMDPDEARDLVFFFSQYTTTDILRQDRSARIPRSGFKSTILMCSGNNSLHQLINTKNTAGLAGSMRVFEIVFSKYGLPHDKPQADAYLRALTENYGHLGEAFMAAIMPLLDKIERRVIKVMADLDRRLNMEGGERYWSGTAAVVLVACDLGNRLGLIPYDVRAIENWLVDEQVPFMRGQVRVEADRRTPEAILSDFLERISGETIRVTYDPSTGFGNPTVTPYGELKAHYDVHKRELWVRHEAFRKFCEIEGHSFVTLLDMLAHQKIITNKNVRRALGAGTNYEKLPSRCFIVDLSQNAVTMPAPAQPTGNVVALPLRSERRK